MRAAWVGPYAVLMRVLVVDDCPFVRERLLSWLNGAERIELGEAAAPSEVLERIGIVAADLVLLDLHLGAAVAGSSAALGLELIDRIKGALPNALIVVLSNEASEPHRRECLRRGAHHFFDKSLEFELALQLIASRACAVG